MKNRGTDGWVVWGAVGAAATLAAASGAAWGQARVPGVDMPDVYKVLESSPSYRGSGIVGRAMGPDGSAREGFASENMTLLSWLAFDDFPTDPDRGSSCWGYVSPSGREYALYGMSTGTAFVDITDPVNPVIVGVIAGPYSWWREMKVMGHYAYSVNETGSGIQVIDMSQIDQGVVTWVKNKTQGGHATTHTLASNPDSGYIYLCGANIANGGLVAVSTTNPSDPVIVGSWSGAYVHEAQVVSYTSGPYAGKEIAFLFSSGRVRIVDVTSKSNMHQISEGFYEGTRYSHQGWASGDRRWLYLDDEFDEIKGRNRTTTHIFNIENIYAPTYVGFWQGPLAATDHNQYWHEGRLYQANYNSGLQVLDATDPINLERIAYFDTFPASDKAGFGGAWSCFPYYPSGSVIISDILSGLYTVRLGVPCPGDFNGDGSANTLDVSAFLNAWASGGEGADFNEDGSINTLDVAAFLNAWAAGCG